MTPTTARYGNAASHTQQQVWIFGICDQSFVIWFAHSKMLCFSSLKSLWQQHPDLWSLCLLRHVHHSHTNNCLCHLHDTALLHLDAWGNVRPCHGSGIPIGWFRSPERRRISGNQGVYTGSGRTIPHGLSSHSSHCAALPLWSQNIRPAGR